MRAPSFMPGRAQVSVVHNDRRSIQRRSRLLDSFVRASDWVIVAAGGMCKALAKITSWAGYLPCALRDPRGGAIGGLSDGTLAKPASLLPMAVISLIGLAVLFVLASFAVRESRLADPASHGSRVAPLMLALAAAAFLVFGWGFL